MFLSSSLFLLLFSSSGLSNPQIAATDTLVANSLLFNGTEYTKTYTQETGDPFFPIDVTTGSILYEGNWYKDQDFYYDCEEDALVLKDKDGSFRIQLIREKTQAFQWQGHSFVKLNLAGDNSTFYEQAYSGKRNLLVKWKKTMETNSDAQSKYKLNSRLLVQMEGKIVEIKKPEDWFSLMGPSAKMARQWIKSQGISLKKEPLKGGIALLNHSETIGW